MKLDWKVTNIKWKDLRKNKKEKEMMEKMMTAIRGSTCFPRTNKLRDCVVPLQDWVIFVKYYNCQALMLAVSNVSFIN